MCHQKFKHYKAYTIHTHIKEICCVGLSYLHVVIIIYLVFRKALAIIHFALRICHSKCLCFDNQTSVKFDLSCQIVECNTCML